MKRSSNFRFIITILLSTLLFSACKCDIIEDIVTEPVPPVISITNITESGIRLLYSAINTKTFILTTDAPWEITKDEGWFVVNPKSGEAGETIEITITGDYNTGEARQGQLTITANSGNNLKPCLSTETVAVIQDGYLDAGIAIDGLDSDVISLLSDDTDPVVFTVMAAYDWNISLTDASWLSISPLTGRAGENIEVIIKPTLNSTPDKRTSILTISSFDPSYPENSDEIVLNIEQYGQLDSHPEGHVFFYEDFNWIAGHWVAPYTKYGWPSVKIDETNYNEFSGETAGIAEIFNEKQYSELNYAYVRYEGYIKLGNSSQMGSITLPPLTGIDEGKPATLLLQFNTALYATGAGNTDSEDNKLYISVSDGATIGSASASDYAVEVSNYFGWMRHSVIIYNATEGMKVTFGTEKAAKCRVYLDDVSLSRAADADPVAPAAEVVENVPESEIIVVDESILDASGKVPVSGGILQYSVRVNREWTMESDCDWLTVVAVKCGASGTGTNNGASISGNTATVKATALPYNNTQIQVAPESSGEERTGNIFIKCNGALIHTITITQDSGFSADNETEIGSELNSTSIIKLSSAQPWSITIPESDNWYIVSPMSGNGGAEVELTVIATEKNPGIRRFGGFTISTNDSNPTVANVLVSQQTAPFGSVLWDMNSIIAWLPFTVENTPRYAPDFAEDPVINPLADDNNNNNLSSESGIGYISYVHTYPGLHEKCARMIGSTGDPYITGGWPGDYWLIRVPVEYMPANTKVRITCQLRTSATGQKYWKFEHLDGGQWKAVSAVSEAEVNGQMISYTHEMINTTPQPVDVTVEFTEAIHNGVITFRIMCMANAQANGKGALTEPNGGTIRFNGNAPTIEVIP